MSLIHKTDVLQEQEEIPGVGADRGNVWTQQEGSHPQEAPGETNPTGTLITDCQPPEP